MAICAGCRALKRQVKVLERQLAAVERARDCLQLELERETEAAWDLVGDIRVNMLTIKGPRDYPVPLLDHAEGGAA